MVGHPSDDKFKQMVSSKSFIRKYVITSKNGEPMLDVKLLKALCGLLRSALLFYKKLAGELVNMCFEIARLVSRN